MMTKVLAPLDGSPQSAVALWVSLLALDARAGTTRTMAPILPAKVRAFRRPR